MCLAHPVLLDVIILTVLCEGLKLRSSPLNEADVTKLTTGDAEEDYLKGFDALSPGRSLPTFRRNALIPSRRVR
jgi:hypothetical protein